MASGNRLPNLFLETPMLRTKNSVFLRRSSIFLTLLHDYDTVGSFKPIPVWPALIFVLHFNSCYHIVESVPWPVHISRIRCLFLLKFNVDHPARSLCLFHWVLFGRPTISWSSTAASAVWHCKRASNQGYWSVRLHSPFVLLWWLLITEAGFAENVSWQNRHLSRWHLIIWLAHREFNFHIFTW